MRRFILAFTVLGVALLQCTGCTVAVISPQIYAKLPSELDLDPTLLGAWEEKNGTLVSIFPREHGGYVLRAFPPAGLDDAEQTLEQEIEQPATYEMAFGLLPLAEWYLVVPLEENETGESEPFVCMAMLLQCGRDDMTFFMMNPFHLATLIQDDGLPYESRESHITIPDADGNAMPAITAIYLTCDNRALERFLIRHRHDEELLMPMMVLRRAGS